ncbi:glycosyltransferase [Sphingomonas arenae]|uniref:glycosyltransferase n=1 Tax=Sphingomonas arenae TaxID=2812555 RepID=UPI0019675C7A|nr:glycosyltransferase [Sphingomonas arenae]
MRIGYLTSQYPATSHTFIRREVAALRDQGVDIRTYSIRAPGADELVAEEDRQEHDSTFTVLNRGLGEFAAAHFDTLVTQPMRYFRTFVRALRHRPPGLRPMLLAIAHFGESILLARRLRADGITHLHNHFANSAATVGLLASSHLRINWSFTMHGISELDYPAGLMLPEKIEAASFVACVSWFGRSQAMRMIPPREWEKLTVVRCGLELDRLPARSIAPADGRRFICVGRLSPEKGHTGLIQAFAKLRQAQPNVRLDLVGDGPDRAELERQVAALGLEEAVTFLGRLPEHATLQEVANADVLILPSFMEGLPVVLMEAMAMGVPVVASRVAGIPELVHDDVNGLLFTPSHWDELLHRLERVSDDSSLRARFAEQGKKDVIEEFDIRASAVQLEQIFQRRTNLGEPR